MKNLLEKSGYSLTQDTQVWIREGFDSIAYSDGDEVENRIAAAIAHTSDLSALSDAMKSHITDWPSLYHLGGGRANILRPFRDLLTDANVLEVGAGCGAITRYLGECGAQVLALEGSTRRAAIARSRTRDLLNVDVVADRFDHFESPRKFDVITLIGVLEYANQFTPHEQPALAMLARARAMLKPDGKLIIAIENQLGLKYFAGAPEDHLGEPMYGVEARYRSDQPQTYGRKVLAKMLTDAGYQSLDFLSPLPDYKFPVSIVTSEGFACTDFDSGAFASQSVRRDPQLPPNLSFSPELVWPVVTNNGIALDLANSFLIVARTADQSALDASILAYHYSTERARHYCKETIFQRGPDGSIVLQYRSLAGGCTRASSAELRFELPSHANYVHGKPMAAELLELVTQDGWNIEAVGAFLRRYLQVLGTFEFQDRSFPTLKSVQTQLPGACFDLTPQNLVRDSEGRYHAIDREWVLVDGIMVGWLLFRVLLLLAQSLTRFGSTASDFVLTRAGFFVAAIESAGFPVTGSELDAFANMEAAAQAGVTHRTPEDLSNWWADSPLPMKSSRHLQMETASSVADRQAEVARLQATLLTTLHDCSQKEECLRQELLQEVEKRDEALQRLDQKIAENAASAWQSEQQIAAIKGSLQDMINSKSWKITWPLRYIPRAATQLSSTAKLASQAIEMGGGLISTFKTALNVLRTEGLDGFRWRLSNMQRLQRINEAVQEEHAPPSQAFLVTPYYLDPLLDRDIPTANIHASLAIHFHFSTRTDLLERAEGLNAIGVPYDLYISVVECEDTQSIQKKLKQLLRSAQQIKVVSVPAAARPITSLIVQFGKDLMCYDIVAHFRSGNLGPVDGLATLIGPLEGNGGRAVHLLDLLQSNAQIVFCELGASEQVQVAELAKHEIGQFILQQCGGFSSEEFAQMPTRSIFAFFARSSSLRDLLAFPHESFKAEPEVSIFESDFSDILERLLPVVASKSAGRIIKIQEGDTTDDFREFEPQKDYSGSLIYADVKVLSYYLPQFHPTPENDEWHGGGFTEWTKVRAANPLFEGHYQQHIPHPDIGYYLLDSPNILRRQAEQMRQAGVHGQVFYHYWFSGRMILEKPAQMLLAHADIAMPFCFCWANENWTRRWDGNEREILLGQTYSADDARAFIRYLIPFFRDPRYIRVGTRPVLMVYRPSSIPDPAEYLRIWAEECAQACIDAPYVVAVLTRGATNPADFQMDAGLERPLHDWTDGAVPDLRTSLRAYWPMNGSVLSYDQVRDFYMAQNDRKSFDYFRSNVPMWDNTARYGSGALLLHGSTPQSFQQWMEHSIADAQTNLPADRRLVVVNAWNEWAEGTHLEPDTRYGYSYLNSIGRALSGLLYAHELNSETSLPDELRLQVYFSPELVKQLDADPFTRGRFFHCLALSQILKERAVCVNYFKYTTALPLARIASEANSTGDLRIEFRRAVHFAPDVVEHLVQTALATRTVVVCNDYGRRLSAQSMKANGAVHAEEAEQASLLVRPSRNSDPLLRAYRMRSDAWCFELHPHTVVSQSLPRVTTILRFHRRARMDDLMRAISCLYVMRDCIVVPLIAAQDLDAAQTSDLTLMLGTFDWRQGCEPIVDHYASLNGEGDLRSRMLNESLRKVRTKYAAFLDYDDLLFPDAYSWLIQRLRATDKAIAFGRVYWTDYRSELHALTQRRKAFEYGGSHDEFLRHNHAPLHSMLVDFEKVDCSKFIYFDDQRFMEDYLMTLQLFTQDNADWDGLAQNHYVGDYVHSVDREHTLAINDNAMREDLLRDPEYLRCEKRIVDMRKRIDDARAD